MYVLEISTKVYNYYTLSSGYVVLGAIAAIIIAVVVLIVFFAIAGFIIQLLASSSRDNNIDYSSRRGRMAVCKIPFSLAINFLLRRYGLF
jgi:uncharacterized membrane protein